MPIFDGHIIIREVWAENLEEEWSKIQGILRSFPYVGMQTDFCTEQVPKSVQGDRKKWETNYAEFKIDVNKLKLIKLGLTFFDEKRKLPSYGHNQFCVWQFNFSPLNDKNKRGIDATTFCAQLKSSGVISDKNRHWVTFGGIYDFGLLIKMLAGETFPETPREYSQKLKEFFPMFYDIKHVMMMSSNKDKASEQLKVSRLGNVDQAGSNSLLISRMFIKLIEKKRNMKKFQRRAGVIYGFGEI